MALLDSSELLASLGGGQSYESDPDQDIIDQLRGDVGIDVPIELTDFDLWVNYTNDDLYSLDKKVREFLDKTKYARRTSRDKKGWRTTASIVFAWIFSRQPSPSDSGTCKIIHRLLEYYCTSYGGPTTYMGKPVKRVYRFSKFSATNKRPYSLRLRLEEANNAGKQSSKIFKAGPGTFQDKQSHSRRKNRGDGE